jgi:hypothetical protein
MNTANPTTNGAGLSKCTIAFGLSLAVTSVTSALLVVAKELSPNRVMAWMSRLTGQHWVTHSAAAVLLFAILGFVFSLVNGGRGMRMDPGRLIALLTGGIVIGTIIIAGFYLLGG